MNTRADRVQVLATAFVIAWGQVRIETSNGGVHHHDYADVEIDNAALYVRDLITVTEEEPVRAGRGVVRRTAGPVDHGLPKLRRTRTGRRLPLAPLRAL